MKYSVNVVYEDNKLPRPINIIDEDNNVLPIDRIKTTRVYSRDKGRTYSIRYYAISNNKGILLEFNGLSWKVAVCAQ